MYGPCKTCKLLRRSRAKVVDRFDDGTPSTVYIHGGGAFDAIAEWLCDHYFYTFKPEGFGCEHYKPMHGKHWI